jgi:hypothetical protein
MKKVTAVAWLSRPEWAKPGDEQDPLELVYTREGKNMQSVGWLKVGTAEITLTSTMHQKDLVLSMVQTQEAKIKKIQADAENEINNLRRKIMDLQAITFEVQS